MARSIGLLSQDGWIEYVPAYDGIREAWRSGADPDPVIVVLRCMSAGEWQRLRAAPLIGELRKRALAGEDVIADVQAGVFCRTIREVRNYVVNGLVIATGEDLLAHGEPGLVQEIEAAVLNHSLLQAGALGGSASQSGSR